MSNKTNVSSSHFSPTPYLIESIADRVLKKHSDFYVLDKDSQLNAIADDIKRNEMGEMHMDPANLTLLVHAFMSKQVSSVKQGSPNLKNLIKSAAYYFKGIDVGDLALEFFCFEDDRERDFRGGSYFGLGDDDLFEHAVTWLSEVKDLGDMEDPDVEKAAWRMLSWIDANKDSIASSRRLQNSGSKPNLKNTIKSAKEMKLQLFDTGAFKLDLSQEKDNSLLCSTVKGSCDVGAVLSVASRDGYTFQDLSQGVDLSNSPLFTEYQDLLVSTAVLKPDTLQTVKRKIASGVVSGKELGKELQQWGLDNPGQVFQSMQVLGTDLAGGDSFKSVGVPIKSSGKLNQATLDYFAKRGITKYGIAGGYICFEDSFGHNPGLTVSVLFDDGDIGNGWGIRNDMLPCIQAYLEEYGAGDADKPPYGERSAALGQSARNKMIKINNQMVPFSRILSGGSKLGF